MNTLDKLRLNRMTDMILNSPVNLKRPVLEMAIVCDVPQDAAQKLTLIDNEVTQTLITLKKHSEIYRNVRLNIIILKPDGTCTCIVRPMQLMTIKGSFESLYMECISKQKALGESNVSTDDNNRLCGLYAYLKKFQARSKLIILFSTNPDIYLLKEGYKEFLVPFLYRKLLLFLVNKEENKIDSMNRIIK